MQLERGFTSGVNQYYEIGAVIAVGVIGGLGYYVYRSKKGQVSRDVPNRALWAPTLRNPPPQQPWSRTATLGPQGPRPQTNEFEISSVL